VTVALEWARSECTGQIHLPPAFIACAAVSPGCASAPSHGAESSSVGSVIHAKDRIMNNIIYIVGLVVVVLFILSFFGLR
jgi:hypothetical protein